MCGITGVMRQDGRPVDEPLLQRMTDTLSHRGPDGDGLRVDGPVGLGHRRLAIIDLVGGIQPMVSRDGAVWITYNGEVYNYRDVRRDLEGLGETFDTTSDTEVVLRAYERWGVDCLARLRGMFAFGIWDGRRRRMFLARDRAGIKPLVYAWDGKALRFASELKAIVADPEVPRELDADALGDYLTHLFVPGPRTIFRSVKKLPPASYLLCALDGGAPEVHAYWTLRMAPDDRVREAEWVEGLRHRLAEAVDLHMVSDVPIGAFLSGGLDSSTVVACMARASSSPIRTFSIGFDEADFDELAYARRVAARYGTDHFEMVVKPDAIEVLPQLAWQFDEPFADASAIPTYFVSKITREHVTVALSGDGGDENFAGYGRYAKALGLHRLADGMPVRLLRPAFRLAGAALPRDLPGRGYASLFGMDPLRRYFRMLTYQEAGTLADLVSPDVHGAMASPVDAGPFLRLAAAAGTRDYLSAMQYIDIHHYLPEDILTKVDRASMLVSLESRVPLLDHVVMEYAATMPPAMKFRDGLGKHVLKQAMRDWLPAEILTRRKMGFGVPLTRWFRGSLREFARDVLTGARARQRGLLRPDAVAALLDVHLSGRRDRSSQIWSLICLELWCRTWLDRS